MPPSTGREMMPMSASQTCVADSTNVLSTVFRSNVDRLMTFSTSAVAVCCCRDSRSSLNSRAFSIAMTACAAKFCTTAISLSENGRTSGRHNVKTPSQVSFLMSGTISTVRTRPSSMAIRGIGSSGTSRAVSARSAIWMTPPALQTAKRAAWVRLETAPHDFSEWRRRVGSDCTEALALANHHVTVGCLAERPRLFDHRVEYWRELAGRGIDDLQHLGGRGLLLQGFS